MTLRVLIADDEPIARQLLRDLLRPHADLAIVGEAADGAEAVDLLRRRQPDLVLLDIRMPELDGLSVLRATRGQWDGRVIFTTAYDEHAIAAFELQALDYLLKPIAEERFSRSVDRLRAESGSENRARLAALLATVEPPGVLERLAVDHQGRRVVVPIDAVEWLEAADNYVRLHTASHVYLTRGKLTAFEARLHPQRYLRVHRSHVVRLDAILRLEEWSRGGLLLFLRSGGKVEVSRSHRAQLLASLSL